MLGMAWMPLLTKKLKVSYSVVYVFLGMLLYKQLNFLPSPNPFSYLDFTVHITELVVIISLMGSGLKIDEPFSMRSWRIPFRLVTITMVLTIAAIASLAFFLLKFDLPSALLLGAALAPTDPVLAGDVQVGPPMEKSRNEVRFSLTAEAGMNDGMAFPFTWLAITVALRMQNEATLFHWLWFDLFYRVAAGLLLGYLMGKVLAWLLFSLPEKRSFPVVREGFIAISSTLLVYGLTEMASGYGFIAVFVTAVTLRNHELENKFHVELHSFTEQVERMLMAIILLLFGGMLSVYILEAMTWYYVLFAVIVVFLIRPISSWPALAGTKLHPKERAVTGFYGIKGIGSLFYLSFGLKQADFEFAGELWVLASVVILLSIIVHGLSAAGVMTYMQKEFGRERTSPG